MIVGLLLPFVAPSVAGLALGSATAGWGGGTRMLIEKLILLALPVIAAAILLRGMGRGELGWRWPSVLSFLIWAVGGTVALNVVSIVWDKISAANPMGGQLADMGLGKTPLDSLLIIASIVILAPVAEEIIFRVFFHRGARDALGAFLPRWAASLIATAASSLLFMQIHGDPDSENIAIVFIVFGVVTALAYEFTGSVYAAVFVHAATNAYAIASGALDGSAPSLAQPMIVIAAIVAPGLALGLMWLIGRMFSASEQLTRTQRRPI